MRWIVVGEYSGRFRDALIGLGHEAVSCDFLPSETPGPHIMGDARLVLDQGWDGMIAHPTCTKVCNSGSKHLYIGGNKANGREEQRWADLKEGAEFIAELDQYEGIPMRAIENPVMLPYAVEIVGRNADQFVQPWWFGDPFFKATGWWLSNLPLLKEDPELTLRAIVPKKGTDEHKKWSAVHRASPSENRWKDRSRTFPGMATAGARTWGGFASRVRAIAAQLDRAARS